MPSRASGSERSGTPVQRRLLRALLLLFVTTVLFATAVPRFSMLADNADLVSPDDPYVQLDREITAEFGMESPVVWVIEARQGTVWTSELLARVQALTRDVFKIPGVIALDVISLASPNLRDLEVTETSFRPVYLMGRVPDTPEAIEALRRRVEGDPNYRGNLVSLDGRAAMVVANFRTDADPREIGAAARALCDRHGDAAANVYVTGAPVLGTLPTDAISLAGMVAAAITIAGVAVSAFVLGARTTLAMGAAGLLAVLWALFALVTAGLASVPWSVYPLPATGLLGAAIALLDEGHASRRLRVSLAVALLGGFGILSLVVDGPARALGWAGMVGALAAVIAGTVMHGWTSRVRKPWRTPQWIRVGALSLVVLAVFGLLQLQTSLGLAGYGERYLLGSGAADLRAIAQRFPPPVALAVRVRGEGRFVLSPAVLHAFDGVVQAARSDPAVVSAMSLADLVKMVHRAFNDNQDEFLVIPEDRSLIGRYLALAYSPGFRRFVDRALANTAIWIYVRGDQAADLSRILGRAEAQLAAHPVPDGEVDLVGGDGAVILVVQRTVQKLIFGAVAAAAILALVLSVLSGWRLGLRALAGGIVAGTAAAGTSGWLGVPIDLVTLPLVIGAGFVGSAFGALSIAVPDGLRRLSLALAVMSVPALVIPYAGANVLGAVLLAVVLASWTVAPSASE